MDGDLAPLPALADIAARHDAWLLSDDAHGVGVVGKGRGSSFAHGEVPDIPLQMGTLSKALGSYGGYLTGLALGRNSDIFKAGVDIHGVHDWTNIPDFGFAKPVTRYEKR